jgi:hypothetical protein
MLDFSRCTLRDAGDAAFRWYAGEIAPGEIFAWEPDLPHARELVLVTRVIGDAASGDRRIYTRGLDDRAPKALGSTPHVLERWNEESRFREAVVPTLMKPWPVERAA